MQVSGDLRLGETDGASNVIFARLVGGAGQILQFVPPFATALLGVLGTALLDEDSQFTARDGIWLTAVLLVAMLPCLFGPLIRERLQAGRRARGEPDATFCRYDADDHLLRISFEGGAHEIAWTRVSEIVLARDAWVIMAGIGYCLPRRLFADAAAEAAFLDYMLSRLSSEAVARSWDASFVRSGKAAVWTGYGKA